MKIFSLLVSVIAAENSLMVGTEQAECGGELCGTQHGRNKGSQVCMRVDQAAIDYYGSAVGALDSERCFCIYAFRWHQSQGRNWPVVASKTPECAYAYLKQDLNIVSEEAGAELANESNSDGRCDDATRTKNGH